MFNKYNACTVINNFFEKYHQHKILINHYQNSDFDNLDDYKVDSLINVFFEPTNRCNLNCAFCAREKMSRKLEMINFESYIKTIDSMKKGSYITFSGNGEPLINPNIYKMIKYAHEKGIYASINTNASALNAENRIKLIESGVSRVQFSFQSIDKETNESLMVGSVFERDLLNILEFIYEVRKRNAEIYISISRVNYEASDKYAEITKNFWSKIPIDNYYEGALLSLQTDSKAYSSINKKERYKPCSNPWTIAKINVNGDVNICPQDFANKYSIGNINDQSLTDVLNSEKAVKLRKAVLSGDFKFLNEIGYCCDKCNTWTSEVKHGLDDYINYYMPVHLSLIVNELCVERPADTNFLEKAISILKNGSNNFIEDISNKMD